MVCHFEMHILSGTSKWLLLVVLMLSAVKIHERNHITATDPTGDPPHQSPTPADSSSRLRTKRMAVKVEFFHLTVFARCCGPWGKGRGDSAKRHQREHRGACVCPYSQTGAPDSSRLFLHFLCEQACKRANRQAPFLIKERIRDF